MITIWRAIKNNSNGHAVIVGEWAFTTLCGLKTQTIYKPNRKIKYCKKCCEIKGVER